MIGGALREPRFRILLWCGAWLSGLLAAMTWAFLGGAFFGRAALEQWVVDDNLWHHNGFALEALKRSPREPRATTFVALGGSICLNGIGSDPAIVTRELRRAGIGDVDFVRLCSNRASLANSWMLVDALRDSDADFVLLVNPLLFARPRATQLRDDYFFLPTPPGLRRLLVERGASGLDRVDAFRFWRAGIPGLRELSQNAWASAVVARRPFAPWALTRQREKTRRPVEKTRASLERWGRYHERYAGLNHELLEGLLAELRSRGRRLAIIEMPTDPAFDPDSAAVRGRHDERMRSLARSGAAYYDLRRARAWRSEEFRDVHHLNSLGRPKFLALLVGVLGEEARRARAEF